MIDLPTRAFRRRTGPDRSRSRCLHALACALDNQAAFKLRKRGENSSTVIYARDSLQWYTMCFLNNPFAVGLPSTSTRIRATKIGITPDKSRSLA